MIRPLILGDTKRSGDLFSGNHAWDDTLVFLWTSEWAASFRAARP
jgi:hypothetical protein